MKQRLVMVSGAHTSISLDGHKVTGTAVVMTVG